MKISQINRYTGYAILAGALAFCPIKTQANNEQKNVDTFVNMNKQSTDKIPLEGTNNSKILAHAPSCKINIQGQIKNAVVVVDLASNTLYQYDKNGNPMMAYPIAKGKPSTPTSKGLRRVSHIEYADYKTAPPHTKRHKNPAPYGKRVIVLDVYNPKTGEISTIGEFIHGTNNPSSIGGDYSNGCMRMANEAVIQLAKYVKRGDFILIR